MTETVKSQINSESEKPNLDPKGIGPKSVSVFGFGLAGSLIWGVGIIPSIIALSKARKARREIEASQGNLKGLGLIKWGIALAIAGILNFIAGIALIFGVVWAVNQIPIWMEEALTDGNVAGIEIADTLPPINLQELGLPEESLNTIEEYLPEGQSLESVKIGDLLEIAESEGINVNDYVAGLDADGTLGSSQSEEIIKQLEAQGYISSDIESLLPEGESLDTVSLSTLLEVISNQSGSLDGVTLDNLEELGLDGFGLEGLLELNR
jgi:hypothetical protein